MMVSVNRMMMMIGKPTAGGREAGPVAFQGEKRKSRDLRVSAAERMTRQEGERRSTDS